MLIWRGLAAFAADLALQRGVRERLRTWGGKAGLGGLQEVHDSISAWALPAENMFCPQSSPWSQRESPSRAKALHNPSSTMYKQTDLAPLDAQIWGCQ